ncbi:hypothetical protein FJT64_013938 [Amphibalanus amphitrite]|uniref:Uncharacterized protein n=1 Tax=Amphibalanus amphitrite TaxID=1232801 RepID=A0A6A4V3I7_AMPAM|nr:hypothetical protein FJT64_013938 [Amphibalanus amphitrite]
MNLFRITFRRWLTLATRLLRVYIGSDSPTDQLHLIVQYLVGHYVPMWFHIRSHSTCSSGAKNVMRSLELLRQLPLQLQSFIHPVIQRNAFWCHPEAVLLGMTADQDPHVRERAVQVIMECRQKPREQVRPYVLPKVNFSASNFTELLDWSAEDITEPPLTMTLSDAEIRDICATPLEIGAFPVHTVAVERAVKVVTEAAGAVVGEKQRHGWICSRLRHRQQLPAVFSKKSFHA